MTAPADEPEPAAERDTVPAAYRDWLTATAGLAETTARTYTGHLGDYHRWWRDTRPGRPLDRAGAADVEAYLAHLAARGLRAATRRTALHALRAYYRWLTRPGGRARPRRGRHRAAHGHRPHPGSRPEPGGRVRRPRVPKPETVIYTAAEADAILARAAIVSGAPAIPQADGTDEVGLDHAVLATLRWTGVRASELCHLKAGDLDLDEEVLHVAGKGSKHRWIPLPPPLVTVLTSYLDARAALEQDGPVPDRLFLNPACPTLRLEPRALLEICRRHGNAAGVRAVTPR